MKDPAFLFYTKDFQSGTQDMSCEELGAYLRLLMYQHQHGTIPNEIDRLMRITGIFTKENFTLVWKTISVKFNILDNHLVNERLLKETNQRQSAKPKKIASATLAGLISSNKLTINQKKEIKKIFNILDFIDFEEDLIKEKVKEWFYKNVNQMVNNLANENANENAIIDIEKGGVEEKTNLVKNEIDNSIFITHAMESKSWISTVAMQLKKTEPFIIEKLIEFELHLKNTLDNKNNQKEFASHFVNWLNSKKTTSNGKQQTYTSVNDSFPDNRPG